MTETTIASVIDALPDRGSKIIELQRQYPELGFAIVGKLKDAERRGLVQFNDLTGRWVRPSAVSPVRPAPPPPSQRIAIAPAPPPPPPRLQSEPPPPPDEETQDMGDATDERKACEMRGCKAPKQAGRGQKYCAEHAGPKKGAKASSAAPARKKAGRKLAPELAGPVKALRAKSRPQPSAGSALESQVGGDHYKTMAIQPIEYAHANNLGPCEFAIVKYVSRHRKKGGRLDLEKARHFLDLLEELTYGKDAA